MSENTFPPWDGQNLCKAFPKSDQQHPTRIQGIRSVSKEGMAYYIPPRTVKLPISTTDHFSFCQFKGSATYYAMMSPIDTRYYNQGQNLVINYNAPREDYKALTGYLAFLADPWECHVNGERARFSLNGGWVTSDSG
ncbi:hypothetical protein QBC42DRAFT_252699 [Cladorrhinum samala]|uniref:DUF427 domain-containing protein n=1 Tax=Cladorrhinum samala TaxID=585594 RepID=A0AAV9HN88_9PEZI|nr:hypothetical protein QBC42DRAFT_252699 [Cladorrhinum samala]